MPRTSITIEVELEIEIEFSVQPAEPDVGISSSYAEDIHIVAINGIEPVTRVAGKGRADLHSYSSSTTDKQLRLCPELKVTHTTILEAVESAAQEWTDDRGEPDYD